jgi:hypothetical protein
MVVTTYHQLRHHSLLECELIIIFRENIFAKFWTHEQPCCSNNNQSKLISVKKKRMNTNVTVDF